jgi:hypothetical protein
LAEWRRLEVRGSDPEGNTLRLCGACVSSAGKCQSCGSYPEERDRTYRAMRAVLGIPDGSARGPLA